MKKSLFICFLSLLITHYSFSQSVEVYPSNWWAGMKWNKVQLMVYGKNVGHCNAVRINYPGITISKINRVESKNYLFVDIIVSASAKPGNVKIGLVDDVRMESVNFELKPRRAGKGTAFAQGV